MSTFRAMPKEEKAAFLKELRKDEVGDKEGAKEEEAAMI